MDRADLLNKMAAAMQDEIGVTDDPTGDYDIAISSAAVVAVDVLGVELDTARARVAELEADNEQLRQGVAQARRLLNAPAADTTSGGWHDGEDHECPRDSRVHAATSRCADYAVKHGDRTYLGPRG